MKKCYVVIGFISVLFACIACAVYNKHCKEYEEVSVVDVEFLSIEQQQELARTISKKAGCSVGIAGDREYDEFVESNPVCRQYIVFNEINGLVQVEYGNGNELPKSKVMLVAYDYTNIMSIATNLVDGKQVPDEFMKLVCIVACIFGTAEVIDFQYVKHWKFE